MPLIIITGFPCCGKTTFANALAEKLRSTNLLGKNSKDTSSSVALDSSSRTSFTKEMKSIQNVEVEGEDNNKEDNNDTNHNTDQISSKTNESMISNNHNVIIINEESEQIKKSEAYMFSSQEKNTRSVLKSAVGHKLNAHSIVICDSLNYIKGYRYELYCIAKTFRTPHCVVWIEADDRISFAWNSQRDPVEQYEEATMIDLRRRFEIPNEKNRWDMPLFRFSMTPKSDSIEVKAPTQTHNPFIHHTESQISSSLSLSSSSESLSLIAKVESKKSSWKPKIKLTQKSNESTNILSVVHDDNIHDDDSKSIIESKISTDRNALSFSGSYVTVPVSHSLLELSSSSLSSSSLPTTFMDSVIEKIIDYLRQADKPTPNESTKQMYHGSADTLYELDQVSKTIMDLIINHQNNSSEGTPIILSEYNRSLALHRRVAIPELQRHRRQFIKVNSTNPPQAIGEAFIDFLALQI